MLIFQYYINLIFNLIVNLNFVIMVKKKMNSKYLNGFYIVD